MSPYYDSMIAKIIVTGSSRLEAVRRLRRALEELIIEGVKTNREFMHLLTYHKDFIRGNTIQVSGRRIIPKLKSGLRKELQLNEYQ